MRGRGPVYGALDGFTFRLEMDGHGQSEWRIRDPMREELVVIRGGSDPAVLVGGQLSQVIPEPYGHVLALQHPELHLHSLEPTSLDVSTAGTETTVVSRHDGDRTMRLTADPHGWLLRKTVRVGRELIDAVELTELVHGPGAPTAAPVDWWLRGLEPRGSWSMGAAQS